MSNRRWEIGSDPAAFDIQGDTTSPTIKYNDADVINLGVGWRDLRCPVVTGKLPAVNFPSLAAFGPTGTIEMLSFAVGERVFLAAHIDHDIKVGVNVLPHVHWATDGTDTAVVKWQLTYTLAKGHNQAAFPAETVITVEEAGSGTAWQHMITEHATGFDPIEPDVLVLMELERVTNGGVDNADAVFGLFVDFHYQVGMNATPSRTPDFYS